VFARIHFAWLGDVVRDDQRSRGWRANRAMSCRRREQLWKSGLKSVNGGRSVALRERPVNADDTIARRRFAPRTKCFQRFHSHPAIRLALRGKHG
jgi:hypothetical protein